MTETVRAKISGGALRTHPEIFIRGQWIKVDDDDYEAVEEALLDAYDPRGEERWNEP